MRHEPKIPHRAKTLDDPAMKADEDSSDMREFASLVERPEVQDLLIHLVGRYLEQRIDPLDARQQRYYEWLARETRAEAGPETAEEAEQATAFAARILERQRLTNAVSRSGVRRVNRAPETTQGPQVSERAAPLYDVSVAAGVGRELWDEPATDWVRLPDDVSGHDVVALRVSGDSMTPLLHDGDTILVKRGTDAVQGRIIVARHPTDGYLVKRVARVSATEVELASLNASYASLTVPADSSLVLGTVILRWCPHGSASGQR
jgi:phage repressor protein C with HTH and peptisase S24 domain